MDPEVKYSSKKIKNIFFFLACYLASYKGIFIGLLLTCFFWAFQTALTPYCIKILIDTVISDDSNSLSSMKDALWGAGGFILLITTTELNFRVQDYFELKLLPSIQKDIWQSLFNRVQRNSFSFFRCHASGNLINKILDISNGVRSLIKEGIPIILGHIFSLVIAAIMLATINKSFCYAVTIWAIIFLSASIYFTKKAVNYWKQLSEIQSDLSAKTLDCINNILNIKFFKREAYEYKRIEKETEHIKKADQKLQVYLFKVRFFQSTTFIILIITMIYLLLKNYQERKITPGDFIFVLTLSLAIFHYAWFLALRLGYFTEIIGKCNQALSILMEIEEPAINSLNPLKYKGGEIIFDRVSFSYDKKNTILNNLFALIKAGEKIGLVGSSGSGKSTLISLLLRTIKANKGRILIDGQDITSVTPESLYELIAVVPQQALIFNRSIKENIAYGKFEATKKQFHLASKAMLCEHFINQFKKGYETVVNENANNLSKGQAQRVAIARALLKDAKILIMDEPTPNLDSLTESLVLENLFPYIREKTTIIISHNLSILKQMDRLLVLKEGKIIAQGPHEELLQNSSYYKELWDKAKK